jgi:hypothetical protein
MTLASVLDPIHDTLDPAVWENPGQAEPRLKHQHLHWIKSTIQGTLEKHGYESVDEWATYYLTGSLTTYQYAPDSDVDISIYVNTQSFPEWSRSEMIGLMISEFGDDGTKLPGTQHPLQVYVVPAGTQPSDIYMPGLRSAYDLQSDSWFVAPEKTRAHDVQVEYRRAYAMALDGADKMELLLQYEPHKAAQYYDQVHRRRMHDQQAAKGDYSDSNILYKFLEKRGLAKQALDYKRMEKGAMHRMAAGDHQSVLDANRGQDLAGLPPQANVPGYGPLNFGPHGEQNQTAGQGDTVYAPQKAGLMPEWTADPNIHAQRTASRFKPKIVRKWVYNDGTGELHHTEFGREEGEVPSHYQLARGWGVENPYSDPNINLGTISQSGWVQFEGGGGGPKQRYRAQQAIKDKFGEQLEGFMGGEMTDPTDLSVGTPTWTFDAPIT